MIATYLLDMTFPRIERDLEWHREVVKSAMSAILGIQEIDGRAVGSIVDAYYGAIRPDARMLLLHEDPLRLAYLLSGDHAGPKMTVENERTLLGKLWSDAEGRLAASDNRAEARP